jgi:hypothetical protein
VIRDLYGDETAASAYAPLRSVIGPPELAPAGNLVLRVGRQNPEGGWSQTEHVVMTPDEADDFLRHCHVVLHPTNPIHPLLTAGGNLYGYAPGEFDEHVRDYHMTDDVKNAASLLGDKGYTELEHLDMHHGGHVAVLHEHNRTETGAFALTVKENPAP